MTEPSKVTCFRNVGEVTEPSKVIHFRNVGPEIVEHDLLRLSQRFGVVEKILMVRVKNQALVQMQDIPSAMNFMQYYSTAQPIVRDRKTYVQFSKHQVLVTMDRPGQLRRFSADKEVQPSRILLITIHNPLYPITLDMLHQVFSPHGYVEKIVTYQKSIGLQALLQFSLQQSAIQAKHALEGLNIYVGCCTLDIRFSALRELKLKDSNPCARDYTKSGLPSKQQSRPTWNSPNNYLMSSLSGGSGNDHAMQHAVSDTAGLPRPVCPSEQMNMDSMNSTMKNSYQTQMVGASNAAAVFGGVLPTGITGTNERSALLISNLHPDHMDANKLFNLFSNYGNVIGITESQSKPNQALIQMGDGFQAELAVKYLSNVTLFGKQIEVNFSKHIQRIPSPATRDYSASKLNRFHYNATKNYRNCCCPSKTIHVSSLSDDVTVDDISRHLATHGNVIKGEIFESNGKRQALLLFENVEQSTEALICKHASRLKGSTIRLAFSRSTFLKSDSVSYLKPGQR